MAKTETKTETKTLVASTPKEPARSDPAPVADGVILERDAEGWSVYVVRLQGGVEISRKRTEGPLATRAYATDALKIAVVHHLILGGR